MSASALSPTQFWHSRSGPAAPYSQEKRGPERPSSGDRGERNPLHIGYGLHDNEWKPRA